jgi:predicted acetyltransferase
MTEIVRAAREREFVLSALMPFRVSFYEHFGYGLVERRIEWTIPLATIIHHDCPGWRLAMAADRPAQFDQWQKAVESGQCDVERPQSRWKQLLTVEEDGMTFIERSGPTGPVTAFAYVVREAVNGRNVMRVQEWSADSSEAFGRLLAFFGTMRDQFSFITITTPADLPVNRLLREPQVPHRPIDHPSSDPKAYTRMQLRILDHRKFLESIRWPAESRGKVTVGIAECEGHVSRLAIEIEGGRAKVTPATGDLDFECLDRQWAAIAAGDLSASSAVRWGLARQNKPSATVLLDALTAGPAPFCREAF